MPRAEPARGPDHPVLVARRGVGRRGVPGAPRLVGYLYVLPALSFFGCFVLWPLVRTLWLSLHEWDGVTEPTWVGLDNFEELAEDELVRQAFGHAAVLIGFYAVLPISVALVITAALSRRSIRGLTFYRTVLFLPYVISTVVVGVIWRWIYTPDGPLNEILRAVGLDALARGWLADFSWALPAIGLVGTWVLTGLCMALFLAGVQQIPGTLYEAARVDGAGPVREFFAITLPGLRNVLAVAATLTVILALRAFDLIFVMTRGGPGTSTVVPGLEIYRNAFLEGEVGYAAAIAAVLTILLFAVSALILRIAERGDA
jgi:raffinose/stachyose/melibiose transport system permease protein